MCSPPGPARAEQVSGIRRVWAREAPVVELATSPGRELVRGNGSFGKPSPLHGQLFDKPKSLPKSFFWNRLLGPGYYWMATGPTYDASCSNSLVGYPKMGSRWTFLLGKGSGQAVYPVGHQQQTMLSQQGNRFSSRIASNHPTVCSAAAIPSPDTALDTAAIPSPGTVLDQLTSGFAEVHENRRPICSSDHQDSLAWKLALEPKEWELTPLLNFPLDHCTGRFYSAAVL